MGMLGETKGVETWDRKQKEMSVEKWRTGVQERKAVGSFKRVRGDEESLTEDRRLKKRDGY